MSLKGAGEERVFREGKDSIRFIIKLSRKAGFNFHR